MKVKKIILQLFSFSLLICSSIDARAKSKLVSNKVTQQVANLKDRSLDSISFSYRLFTAKECKESLNAKNLIKKGYQPIQITVTNKSDKNISISSKNFSLPCVSVDEITEVLYQSRKKQSRNLGIAGCFVGGWTLIVPSIVRSYGADDYHDEMHKNLTEKSLSATVLSGATVSGLIFVKRSDFRSDFSLNFNNESVAAQL